jgi:D-alanine-D-alanine ligase
MDKNKKILVVYGGPSSESEVSKNTAKGIFNALKNLGYKTEMLEFSFSFHEEIKKINPDIVYNAMHGAFGEDGSLPGLLECMRIPYTHSGVRASAIAMDKVVTKNILINHDVRFSAGKVLSRDEVLAGKYTKPCVIKPIADGSSVGVIILKSADELDNSALLNTSKFLVEDFVEGRELSVAVLDGKALGIVEIRPKSGVYDYKSKYTSGASEYLIPAPIPANIEAEAGRMAEIAHNIIGCKGVTRSDMIYSEKEGKVYFLEINTHPGMTETSLVPKIAASKGISYEQVVENVVNTASLEILPSK